MLKRTREQRQSGASTEPGTGSQTSTPKQPSKRPRARTENPQSPPLSNIQNRPQSNARKSLSFSGSEESTKSQSKSWSNNELQCLTLYLCGAGFKNSWPAFGRKHQFWKGASEFMYSAGQSTRTADACRNTVQRELQHQFSSPNEAKAVYTSSTFTSQVMMSSYVSKHSGQSISTLPQEEQITIITKLFQEYSLHHYGLAIPSDFLVLSLQAMTQLDLAGRTNVVYNLAKAVGTKRSEGVESRLPVSRMPMGLIEYCINFFNASNAYQVHCPDDYRRWLGSMFTLFGTKWVKLFCGPMWKIVSTVQSVASEPGKGGFDPTQAKVNVPGLSERTIQRDIASGGISLGSEVQIKMIDAAHKKNPNTNWWLKGDGCDIVSGLQESMRNEWNGDVDLDDGDLKKQYKVYSDQLKFYKMMRIGDISEYDLQRCSQILLNEKKFILTALEHADATYRKSKEEGAKPKQLFSAGWKVDELQQLRKHNQQLIVNVHTLLEEIEQDPMSQQASKSLPHIREGLCTFHRNLYQHKRKAATHVFVLMISSERRETKPYAIPVQMLPYHSINEQTMRRIICNVLNLMKSRGMNVVGFASNGEYNSMRNQGYTRPLSVLQVRSTIRAKYSRMSRTAMLEMLTPKLLPNGRITAVRQNPAVSPTMLCEIVLLRQVQGLSWEDILSHLRSRTVPSGFSFHSWIPGKKEEVDKLRSILSQLDYTRTIREYDANGVPFRTHLHVPECHPETGTTFYEREDPGHVLKRIAKCTRNGGPQGIRLEHYVEALKDESSGLTYSALVGMRKQSVEDAERMFSLSLARFMESKNYTAEAKFIRAVNGWRRALDERGLSQLERCRLNYQFLQYILDELMPWHGTQYDFSLLEVNTNVANICGFTREVLTALISHIETCEFRRVELQGMGLPPEHPRASTTDDVECFFSVVRDLVGKNFTLKQVKYSWRKICIEYEKRNDPDLPFFYYTSSHDRFYEGERLSFDTASKKRSTGRKRIPRAESMATSVFSSGKATVPSHKTLHTRAIFHNPPEVLPPPPDTPIHLCEHSYAN